MQACLSDAISDFSRSFCAVGQEQTHGLYVISKHGPKQSSAASGVVRIDGGVANVETTLEGDITVSQYCVDDWRA